MQNLTKRKAVTMMVAALAVAALAATLSSDKTVFRKWPGREQHYRNKLAQVLRQAGAIAYLPMDEACIRDHANLTSEAADGVLLTAGVRGAARELIAAEHGYIHTEFCLPLLTTNYTLSCWLRFPQSTPNQHVCQLLRVEQNALCTSLRGQTRPLRWPLEIKGQFFHLALTVDGATRIGRLYINGNLKDEADLGELHPYSGELVFGQAKWTPPAGFALDEVSVWNRGLTPDEILALSRPRQVPPIPGLKACLLKLAFWETLNNTAHSLLSAADLFNPRLLLNSDDNTLPVHTLDLSKHDHKEFNQYQDLRTANGRTAAGESRARKVKALLDSTNVPAKLRVLGQETLPRQGLPRKAWALEFEPVPGSTPQPAQLFRPPEQAPFLLEILAGRLATDCAVPVTAPTLGTLKFGITTQGAYLCEPFYPQHGAPHTRAPGAWTNILCHLPLFRQETLQAFDQLATEQRLTLLCDPKSPLNSREINYAIKVQRDRLSRLLTHEQPRTDSALVELVATHLNPAVILNGNPAPSFVLHDLDLAPRTINGASVTFASLTPDTLTPSGRVTRIKDPAPIRVTAAITSGAARTNVTLELTAMSNPLALPLLTIDSIDPKLDLDPTTCSMEWRAPDTDKPVRGQGTIRLRGNTSLYKAEKKYFHAEFNEPHGIPGLIKSKHLLLTSAWRDPSLIREKLAYDLFRAFSQPGKPRYAPHVRHVELVLNGDYRGIYEATDRVDAKLLGFDKTGPDPDRPAVLYKAVGGSASLCIDSRDAYEQRIPDWEDGECWGPYEQLVNLLGKSDTATFVSGLPAAVDIDNIIDFELLINLTHNAEGQNYNLYLARGGRPDDKFFLIPWDYDMTFRGARILGNCLTGRMHSELPGYGARLQARWHELRAGILSEAELNARIDACALPPAAVARNFKRWPLQPGMTHEQNVADLRAWLMARLQQLDSHYDGRPPVPAP